jgi:hypothetical protein
LPYQHRDRDKHYSSESLSVDWKINGREDFNGRRNTNCRGNLSQSGDLMVRIGRPGKLAALAGIGGGRKTNGRGMSKRL